MKIIQTFIGFLVLTIFSYANSQTTQYLNEYGAPIGTSNQKGNKVEYSNQWGAPIGEAVTNGNKTTYSNQYGAPTGSSIGFIGDVA